MTTANSTMTNVSVNLSELVASIKAVKTEGKLCQKNWQAEIDKESPSEKRLSFLSNQAVRLNRVLALLNSLLPPDYEIEESPKSLPSPMDFQF